MATTQEAHDSDESDYRIELTDIKGVGPATVDKLAEVGITTVDELHLVRHGRASTTNNRLQKQSLTIGKDTWDHLAEVGEAAHYSGSTNVEARHLTCDLADGKDPWQWVDIAVQDDSETDDGKTEPTTEYTTDELADALTAIHDEYDEGYGGQVSFEGDLGRFLHESDTFDGDDKPPQGIIQSVARYRHEASTVEAQGDFTDDHKAVLVDFGRSL